MDRTEILKQIEYWYKRYEILDDELEKIKAKVADLDMETVQIVQNIEVLRRKIEPMVFDKKEESIEEILNP